MAPQTKKLLYFTDPMCSWCYGFGAEIEVLAEMFCPPLDLEIIPGGLRPDETRPMPAQLAREVAGHWHHVQEAAGVPFAWDFFERHPDFVYNTAPACRALQAAQAVAPDKTLAYLHALQQQYYALGEDPTRIETFVLAATEVGIDGHIFRSTYLDPETETATRAQFQRARDMGVTGYPTVLLQLDDRLKLISHGYQRADVLRQVVPKQVERLGFSLEELGEY